MHINEWMTDISPKREWWLKIKEHVGHKRTKQKGKIETTGFLPHEIIR
jgi:hypothetical protein